jgi:hypothetical protein
LGVCLQYNDDIPCAGFGADYHLDDRTNLKDQTDGPVPFTVAEIWSPDGWIHHPTHPANSDLPEVPR